MKSAFKSPPKEFSALPFWFWNDRLDHGEIERQIEDFASHGVHGFVIHPRMGVPGDIPYLSDAFFSFVETALKKARELGMQVILYDEAMYPSGSAHGAVASANPRFATRALKREPAGYAPEAFERIIYSDGAHDYVETFSRGHIRGIHFGEDDGESAAPPSADLLNSEAMELFVRLTHDEYHRRFAEYFGSTVIGFFTDEPSLLGRGAPSGLIPWTDGLLEEYVAAGGRVEDVPSFWEGDRLYRAAVQSRLDRAFYKTLSDWCAARGVALMGHPAQSEDIGLLRRFHVPGQDVVWRYVAPGDGSALTGGHSTMAKCSADAARAFGRRRNSSECFGACNKDSIPWNFTADEMKWILDWLFVRGVNMIIPHAFYYSIDGARAFERPPDVGPNNLWWKHFRLFADYIARMSYLLTDCVNCARIAVLCEEDELPWAEVAPLYESQTEFNYLQKSLLPGLSVENGAILAGENRYEYTLCKSVPGVLEYDAAKHGRDIVTPLPCPDLRFTHIKKEGFDFFIFTNEGEESISTAATLPARGACERWDAWTGSAEGESALSFDECSVTVALRLGRRESAIYRVDPSSPPRLAVGHAEPPRRAAAQIDISEGVLLNGAPLESFASWTELPGLESFSGELAYAFSFTCPPGRRVELELLGCRETAEARINGRPAGVRLWAPHAFDITGLVSPGENRAEILVCNSMANRLSGAKLPSGITQGIRIKIF